MKQVFVRKILTKYCHYMRHQRVGTVVLTKVKKTVMQQNLLSVKIHEECHQ